ncbi:uncharacterized protein KY384_005380 [Bacidia gigantensis]|uniref:uncharacterized protein n=1 Tax=Bacidia gigantensis TaxID=2732470 RepID=UPI001D04F3FF|nr:uncharacterized protein KY384_005380 [Bacidia gigantensis]KAG8529899.1 hypothetical protein KY384_005380 [Bacidia gigantensis]
MAIGVALIEAEKSFGDGTVFSSHTIYLNTPSPSLHAADSCTLPEHLSAIKATEELELKAVYSSSQVDAEELAAENGDVDAFFDSPNEQQRSFDALLCRKDIGAFIITLPLNLQADNIRRALKAEKHVLSDAPIAKDVETAKKLLEWYADRNGHALWSVGESYRFKDTILFGGYQLKRLDGAVQTFTLKMYAMAKEDDKLYQCLARQDQGEHGGFVLDVGVHFVAAVRFLLSSANATITQVAAFTSLLRPEFSSTDTANAALHLSNGNSGTMSLSFGTEFDSAFEIHIVTDKGAVMVTDRRVTVIKDGEEEDTEQEIRRDFPHEDLSLKRELAVFATGILKEKEIERRGLPQESLADLKLVQAMIESGEENGAVKAVD